MKKQSALICVVALLLMLFSAVNVVAAGNGDANGDGSLDMKDVLLTRKYIAKMVSSVQPAADMNGDGSIDMKDVLKMRRAIAAVGSASLYIDPLTDSQISIDPTTLLYWDGTFTYEGQTDSYTLTAQETGVYRFELANIPDGYRYYLKVRNAGGNTLDWNNASLGQGVTVDLTAGQTYTITIEQYSDYFGNYTLKIGKAKAVEDISAYKSVQDSIQFTDQINVYTFTATQSGAHRFELANIPDGYRYYLKVRNAGGNALDWNNASLGQGVTVTLTAGQTYTITIEQYSDYFGHYTLKIGKP